MINTEVTVWIAKIILLGNKLAWYVLLSPTYRQCSPQSINQVKEEISTGARWGLFRLAAALSYFPLVRSGAASTLGCLVLCQVPQLFRVWFPILLAKGSLWKRVVGFVTLVQPDSKITCVLAVSPDLASITYRSMFRTQVKLKEGKSKTFTIWNRPAEEYLMQGGWMLAAVCNV